MAYIISAVADALAWGMLNYGVNWLLYYLDNIVVVGGPELKRMFGSSGKNNRGVHCHREYQLHQKKTEGSGQVISFSGIIIDTAIG